MTWRDRAACTGADTEAVFYPTPHNGRPADYRIAASYCGHCPVRDDCLADALLMERTVGLRHGYRGGATPEQRAQMVKRR